MFRASCIVYFVISWFGFEGCRDKMTGVVDLTGWDGVMWPWPPASSCKRKTVDLAFRDSAYWNTPLSDERPAKRRRVGYYDISTPDYRGYWDGVGTYQDVFNNKLRETTTKMDTSDAVFQGALALYTKFHADGNADVVGDDGEVKTSWIRQVDRAIRGASLNDGVRNQIIYALKYGDRSEATAVLYEQLVDAVIESMIN